jgi:hypothetical protein
MAVRAIAADNEQILTPRRTFHPHSLHPFAFISPTSTLVLVELRQLTRYSASRLLVLAPSKSCRRLATVSASFQAGHRLSPSLALVLHSRNPIAGTSLTTIRRLLLWRRSPQRTRRPKSQHFAPAWLTPGTPFGTPQFVSRCVPTRIAPCPTD